MAAATPLASTTIFALSISPMLDSFRPFEPGPTVCALPEAEPALCPPTYRVEPRVECRQLLRWDEVGWPEVARVFGLDVVLGPHHGGVADQFEHWGRPRHQGHDPV